MMLTRKKEWTTKMRQNEADKLKIREKQAFDISWLILLHPRNNLDLVTLIVWYRSLISTDYSTVSYNTVSYT